MGEETMHAAETQRTELDHQKWYETVGLEDAKAIIRANITTAARSFIAIGYYLKHIRDRRLFAEDGYATIWEFAKGEYGLSISAASRYMSMNDRFSRDGNSPVVDAEYQEFGKSQLQEMLSLTDGQMEGVTPDMTVLDIREIRRPEEMQVPGQMAITEFPECLPELFGEPEDTAPKAETVLSIGELFGELEPVAISQQTALPVLPEFVTEGPAPELDGAIAADLDTCLPNGGDTCLCQEPDTDAEIALIILERKKELLQENLLIPGIEENDTYIRQQRIEIAALEGYIGSTEAAGEGSEQPELPALKNNDQRAAFIDDYETWPLWLEMRETGERYYRYDLADGTSMIVKVYHSMLFNWHNDPECRYTEGYGRHEYYLLRDGKFFRDCDVNRSTLIEKLKEIQKVKG